MITTLRRSITCLAAIATGILLAQSTPLRAAITPAENLLPADTLAFFTVPDTAAFRAACQTSPQIMFWNDAAMKPFHDKLVAKFNEKFVAPLEKDLGLKVADFLALPQGQFTLAVTVNGSTGHDDVPPGLILLLDAKDKGDLLKTNLAALTKKWADAGRKLRTENLHGLSFTVVPLNSNDFSGIIPQKAPVTEIGQDPKPAKVTEVYFTQYQSLLVAVNSAKVAEAIAAHLTGSSLPAIADDATFAADKLAQFRDAPVYYGWFNGTKTFDLLTPADTGGDDSPPSAMGGFTAAKILGATGLGGLKSASFAVREKLDGSSVVLHLTAPEATRNGLLKILALPAKDASIPVFVPADATKFSRFRLDGKQTWAELQKMIAAISPQGLASLNAVIDMANTMAQLKDPGFDLRANLFGNLGDDVMIYSKAPVGDTLADFGNPPTIYLVAVTNPEQVVNAVKNLASLAAPQDAAPKPRDLLGHKIYSIAQRGKPQADGSTAAPSYIYLSAAGGYLAISKSTTMLEEYLRSADGKLKPLRETPGIADAASHVGGTSGGLFSYENQRETMRAAFKLMKLSAAGDSAMKMFPPAFRDWADFSLLPDYDAVSKYFYLSVFGGSANADGLTLKVYAPRPPQLN
jgi:hypothetical protein